MPVFLNDNVFEDKKLYGVTPKNLKDTILLASLLNSTVSRLFIEFTCRQLTGSQAIADIDVAVVERLLVPNPKFMPAELKRRLENGFSHLSQHPAESVFKEIGSSITLSYQDVKHARREIDKIIMGEILGLTEEEQLEVYRAVVDLVKSRIKKAKSIGKKHKTKEGIDIDLLVKSVMERIGDETLEKFYREKVLSQETLSTKALLKTAGKVKIEQSLFGWRLVAGRKYIDCASEAEAKYLQIWQNFGLEEVKVPQDENYLRDIVPELSALKERIDEVIDRISARL